MKIIPAVDIMDGKCVQLVGGKPGTEKVYGDPVEIAKRWVSKGAEILHVIDLDAALGTGENTEIVLQIVDEVDAPVQFGGGIRSIERVEFLLNSGIERIILGTLAIKDYSNEFEILKKLNKKFGSERLIVAVDSMGGNIVIKGWQEKTNLNAQEFIRKARDLVWGFLYTDVDVEGRMQGINLEGVKSVARATDRPVIVSGGISSEKDIKILDNVSVWGIVLGKALYEGRVMLK